MDELIRLGRPAYAGRTRGFGARLWCHGVEGRRAGDRIRPVAAPCCRIATTAPARGGSTSAVTLSRVIRLMLPLREPHAAAQRLIERLGSLRRI